MAKKPMRTATGRGLDLTTQGLAKLSTADKLRASRTTGVTPKSTLTYSNGKIGTNSNFSVKQKEDKLRNEAMSNFERVRRLQAAGSRMGRAMAAAKAKQKGK